MEYKIEKGSLTYIRNKDCNSQRFAVLMEDPCDGGIQTMGFHGRFAKPVTFFPDGHTGYQDMDTWHYHDSIANPPGPQRGPYSKMGIWTVLDESRDHPGGGRLRPLKLLTG